ncbi:MAG: N-acetylmuramoyl-L-alanine amidase [Terriglobales bacterium]
MSVIPNRVGWEAETDDPGSPLQEGNRVLQSIACGEALPALLAFSELHQQIRNRRVASGCAADRDLFETERFILDEVLQLICDRVQSLTHADGIMIALAEESEKGMPGAERSVMFCRAAAGRLAVERGMPLNGASEFLRGCLESGRILRCDDSETDDRVLLDLSHQMAARSTVLVPLRGWRQQLGVLQALSMSARAFTDNDVRCFDLFGELVLSALKPSDQDRRIHWLSNVAAEVLRSKPEAVAEPLPDLPEPTAAHETVGDGTADDAASDAASVPFSIHQTPPEPAYSLPVVLQPYLSPSARPGLSVVLGLVAVAALFSAGAWWGMQVHEKTSTKFTAGTIVDRKTVAPSVQTAPSSAATLPSAADAAADNLMNPSNLGSEPAPLTAMAENKMAALPKITGVRHWSSSMGSTVVIDMDDQVPYEVHRLMSPERIYFDLHDTVLSHELEGKSMDIGDPSLTRVRIGQPVAGVTRVVLDTKDGSNFSVSMESSPYRLVVELRDSQKTLAANGMAPKRVGPSSILTANSIPNPAPASAAAALAPMKNAPAAALTAKAPEPALPAKTGKFRIVLDAGHGGWDLGTVGRQGLLEKDLVLDVTQRLGKLLQARLGSEVMFTRTGDNYLPLDQRADFANQAQADLFISVHANYSSSAAARGVETYYTNLFSAPGSREVEKHDDGTSARTTPVSLSAGGLHEKIEESRRLAASVQHSLYATLAANSPDIRNRGIKDSAFAVLTGTTMPAILTEISFVSSPADERNLQSATYRQQIAEALYKGIAGYQQSSPRAKVAQLRTAAPHP